MVSPLHPTSIEELRQRVIATGGVYRIPMSVLRHIHGTSRLGRLVCKAIAERLAAAGLAHIPEDLPSGQWQEIRVFLADSPLAAVVDAVLEPTAAGDEVLRLIADETGTVGRLNRAAELAMQLADLVTSPGRDSNARPAA